ncbi:MAG TPA: ATP-binding protein, partial [Treponemataceae bacterium]|nr:ATP-binding protein [Treponemataceae bacterium]
MMSIARSDYIEKILPYMNKPVIKVLTGMRRVGKSTILKMLIDTLLQQGVTDKRIVYINMESIRWDFIKDYKDLHAYVSDYFKDVSAESKYVFIDEVQEIKEWERAVNSMLSEAYADIILTGSNAHLLGSDLATFLSGRYIEFPVYPLTFKEFLNFRAGKDQSQREAFKLFLRYGGLPGIHNFELIDEYAFQYLQSVYNTLVLKDVVSRHVIKDPAQLDLIIRFIFDNCGNITTSKRISDYLKNQKISVSVDKVINYLKYLESAFLIKKTMRYDLKGLRHLELYEKYYTGDIGLRH